MSSILSVGALEIYASRITQIASTKSGLIGLTALACSILIASSQVDLRFSDFNPFPTYPDINKDVLALQDAPEYMQNDYLFVQAAVKQNGLSLQYASKAMRDESSIVRPAVEQNGLALQYASEGQRNSQYTVSAAVEQNGLALQYASEDRQNDPYVVRTAVNQSGLALQYASNALRNNWFVIIEALNQNGLALQYVSEKLRNEWTARYLALKQIYSHEQPESQKALLSTQEMLAPNIFIDQNANPDFIEQTKANIKTILSTSIGSSVIAEIGSRQHPVFIVPSNTVGGDTAASLDPNKNSNGMGCGSLISLCNGNIPETTFGFDQEEIEMPNHVMTFHELAHALHNAQGRRAVWQEEPKEAAASWSTREEYTTIAFYENVYRYELGLPLRCSHKSWDAADKLSDSLRSSLNTSCRSVKDQFRYLLSSRKN